MIKSMNAFRSSCIWYFRQVLDAVGEAEVAEELTALGFGNLAAGQRRLQLRYWKASRGF